MSQPSASNHTPNSKAKAATLYWRNLDLDNGAMERACNESDSVFASLFQKCHHAFWLDGAAFAQALSWSYMGAVDGAQVSTFGVTPLLRYEQARQNGAESAKEKNDFFTSLRGLLNFKLDFLQAQKNLQDPFTNAPPFAFRGGYVGCLGYELRATDQPSPVFASDTPDALLLFAERYVAIDHAKQKIYAAVLIENTQDAAQTARAEAWICKQEERLRSLQILAPTPNTHADKAQSAVEFTPQQDDALYLEHIAQAKEWIAQGQSYQICLTNAFRCQSAVSPWDLYRVLRVQNPAPFSAYIQWGDDAATGSDPTPSRVVGAVLSASPERFLQYDSTSHRVQTKPIKGTIKRSEDPSEDSALAEQLAASVKDRAENVMIVDLLRNDLSRVCELGSVRVAKLFDIESFATVHQMVSTVEGLLRPELSSADLLAVCFPGGSMTGAPKIHTMHLLEALEHRARGIYSGALGWLGLDGSLDLSIVIRTIVALRTKALLGEMDQRGADSYELRFGVGGGIVADSVPASELAEMKLKALGSMRAIAQATAAL